MYRPIFWLFVCDSLHIQRMNMIFFVQFVGRSLQSVFQPYGWWPGKMMQWASAKFKINVTIFWIFSNVKEFFLFWSFVNSHRYTTLFKMFYSVFKGFGVNSMNIKKKVTTDFKATKEIVYSDGFAWALLTLLLACC